MSRARVMEEVLPLVERRKMKVTDQMAAEWLPLLETASHEVFDTMLNARLQPSKREAIDGVVFTAMVGLAGGLRGVLSLRCCQQSAAEAAASMMGGEPHEHAGEHAWDALGEMANMIAGNFKSQIGGLSDKCMLTVPTVITGADYASRSLTAGRPLELWFRFHGRPLEVALEIHS